MKHFEVKRGQAVVLSLSGAGFDALQVTVSGQAGANAPVPLMSQRVRASGAKCLELEHEFTPGELDSYEQLQIDPVVYGRAGKAYELTLTLRHSADASPTFSQAVKGKLIASHLGGDKTETGFDAPLFIVTIQAEPKFEWRLDTKTGSIIIDTIDLGVAPYYCQYVIDKPVLDPVEFYPAKLGDPMGTKPMKFDIDFSGLGGVDLSKNLGLSSGGGSLSGLSDFSGATRGAGSRGGRRPKPRISVVIKDLKRAATQPGSKRATKQAAPGESKQLPAKAPADEDAKYYPVWYGTNRAPVLKDGKVIGYSPYRDTKHAHYGRCIVRVPKSHKIGETGSSLAKRILTLTDDRLAVEEVLEVEQKLFWTSVAQQVSAASINKRDVVVFIHGYNVSFGSAAIRAAQLGCDLSIDGAMAFYSWPSRGTLEGYWADEATVQASAAYITDFLSKIAVRSNAENVHVIAHSMGNRATLEAVRDIVGSAQKRAKRLFSQFILAAPDVDAEYFKQFAAKYSKVARRTTMYVSDRDRAVEASRFIHGSVARVGLAPPVQVVKGIDTVYAGYVDESLLGHGYVAEAWQLLNDMHQLIHLDAAPSARSWVTKADAGTYWELVGRV